MDALIGVVLAGCIAAVSYGLVLIPRRLAVALAATRSNHAAEAALVAQARAELASTGWTPHHEALYQAEIAATKRGDLLAAAAFAEEQERAA